MALMRYREANQVLWRGVRPGHNGTQIAMQAEIADGTNVIYTVPDGQTLYLCTVVLVCSGAGAGSFQFVVRTDLDAAWFTLSMGTHLANELVAYLVPKFWVPLEVPEKYDIAVISYAANCLVQGGIHGWVE